MYKKDGRGRRLGCGHRDLKRCLNDIPSSHLYLSNMVSEHRNGAIMQKEAIFIILPGVPNFFLVVPDPIEQRISYGLKIIEQLMVMVNHPRVYY